ncbi:TonB-dependent receptor [Massilia arenosa]|uniref:TonB-dependent receptor n=1 Tax=Zemynaea arenosa TaxID=2561931 RepID=A0A4Y9SFK1_9BURK|nr:TonB-dependent receptor [Massilia arenosa]TFW22421.1 TonB-dependent receptor [Massilia arenosa]
MRAAAWSLLSLAVAGGATAQEAPSRPADKAGAPATVTPPAPANKVEVKAKAEAYDPRRDDTASKIVVGREELLKYGDPSALDVLKRLPGVTVSRGAVQMRGMAGYTQVLVNGERPPSGFSLDAVAPESIEKIEIVRAATAEYSTQAVAGTINIVLKKLVEKAARSVSVGLGTGDAYRQRRVNFSLADKDGKLSWSVFGGAQRNENSPATEVEEGGADAVGMPDLLRRIHTYGHTVNQGLDLGARLVWSLGDGESLSWQNFVNRSHGGGDSYGRSVTELGTARPYPNVDSLTDYGRLFARSELNWVAKFAGGKLDAKLSAYGSRNDRDAHITGYERPELLTQDRSETIESREHGVTSTGKYSRSLFDKHSAAFGWDAGTSRAATDNLMDERLLVNSVPKRNLIDQTFSAEVTRLALFAQDEWNITPRVSTYVGARWEGVRTHASGTSFDSLASTTSVFSPLFHVLWKLPDTKADQLRFAFTRTYRPPALYSLTPRRSLSVNNSQTTPDYQGNPDLKPELATGLDLTFEHYFGSDGGLLSAGVSTRRIDHYIRNTIQLVGDRWVNAPANIGNATTRGLELEAKFPLKTFFANAPAIDVRANLSRNWSTVDAVPGPHNRLDNQTPVSFKAALDHKAGRLTTGTSFNFTNGGWVRVSATETSYTSVNREVEVYALWKFDPKLSLRATAYHELNDQTTATGYQDAYGTLYTRSTVGNRSFLRVQLEYKF